MKKQYTITENNDWEGEVFGYILYLTEDEYTLLVAEFSMSESMRIEPSNFTTKDVEYVNNCSTNTYRERLSFCVPLADLTDNFAKFMEDTMADEELTDEDKTDYISRFFEDEVFYKGKGLKDTTEKKSKNGFIKN